MQKSITLFLITIFFVGSLNAQNDPYVRSFSGYAGYVLKGYGITVKMPKKVTDLDQYFTIRPIHKDRSAGFVYGPTLQTSDKNCILMYPALLMYVSNKDMETGRKMAILNREMNNDTSPMPKSNPLANHAFPRSHVIGEMKAAIGLVDDFGDPLRDSVSFDFNNYVTVIAGKKAKEMFNADSIYIYDLPLEEPYQGKYPHRTGVVISKKDRATMIFKLFFTTKGKKKENEYIELLSKQIWYEEDFSHTEE